MHDKASSFIFGGETRHPYLTTTLRFQCERVKSQLQQHTTCSTIVMCCKCQNMDTTDVMNMIWFQLSFYTKSWLFIFLTITRSLLLLVNMWCLHAIIAYKISWIILRWIMKMIVDLSALVKNISRNLMQLWQFFLWSIRLVPVFSSHQSALAIRWHWMR